MNPLARKQIELNKTTCGDRECFAGHRQRVTRLIVNLAVGGGQLCVLGAGNCNDLHLLDLLAAFREVSLVDLDGEALSRGVSAEPIVVGERLFCIEDDVTGVLPRVAAWSPSTLLTPDDFTALAAGARSDDWMHWTHSRFDVVASTCLLSQLIGSLDHSITSQHPQFVEAVKSIRVGHFRTIASMLKPGGRMVFISDVVSSVTCPDLLTRPDDDRDAVNVRESDAPSEWLISIINDELSDSTNLHRIVAHAIRSGNFFTGLNPVVVHKLLKSDPKIAPFFDDVAFIPPWLWQCGRRSYAVYAITARRTMASGT